MVGKTSDTVVQTQEPVSLREAVEEELESEGTRNEDVTQHLVDGDKLDAGVDEGVCQLCKIYRPPFDQSEHINLRTDDFYIVDTYDKKGHEVRNMAVYNDHQDVPPVKDSIDILNRLADISAKQIQDGEMILYGSMNTFSEHFHMVASDLYGTDPEEVTDVDDINSYARFRIEDGEAEYLEGESRYRDNFGEYLEEWTKNL